MSNPLIELDILEQMARHCPRALATYAICLGHADELGRVEFTKDQLVNDLSESYTRFKNNLKALAREGVLEWHEIGQTLVVSLAAS